MDKFKYCEMLGFLATMGVLGWLTNACLVKKNARFILSQFYVFKTSHRVHMIIDIAEFTPKELFVDIKIIQIECLYQW